MNWGDNFASLPSSVVVARLGVRGVLLLLGVAAAVRFGRAWAKYSSGSRNVYGSSCCGILQLSCDPESAFEASVVESGVEDDDEELDENTFCGSVEQGVDGVVALDGSDICGLDETCGSL